MILVLPKLIKGAQIRLSNRHPMKTFASEQKRYYYRPQDIPTMTWLTCHDTLSWYIEMFVLWSYSIFHSRDGPIVVWYSRNKLKFWFKLYFGIYIFFHIDWSTRWSFQVIFSDWYAKWLIFKMMVWQVAWQHLTKLYWLLILILSTNAAFYISMRDRRLCY